MAKIDPAIAAHNIAKIFCDHNYDKIAKRAMQKFASTNPNGDISVFITKELWDEYASIYDVAFIEAVQDPYFDEFS